MRQLYGRQHFINSRVFHHRFPPLLGFQLRQPVQPAKSDNTRTRTGRCGGRPGASKGQSPRFCGVAVTAVPRIEGGADAPQGLEEWPPSDVGGYKDPACWVRTQ